VIDELTLKYKNTHGRLSDYSKVEKFSTPLFWRRPALKKILNQDFSKIYKISKIVLYLVNLLIL